MPLSVVVQIAVSGALMGLVYALIALCATALNELEWLTNADGLRRDPRVLAAYLGRPARAVAHATGTLRQVRMALMSVLETHSGSPRRLCDASVVQTQNFAGRS